MGMSAAQARLLSITARLTDNEMRSQLITNSKLRLADKSSEASSEYMDALNSTSLSYISYTDSGNKITQSLTPAVLMNYGELKNQYGLVNSSGQLMVSGIDQQNYESSDTLTEFLACYDVPFAENPEYVSVLTDIYGENYDIYHDEDNAFKWEQYFTNLTGDNLSNITNLLSKNATDFTEADFNSIMGYVSNWQSSITSVENGLLKDYSGIPGTFGGYINQLLAPPEVTYPDASNDKFYYEVVGGNSELADKFKDASSGCYAGAVGGNFNCYLHILAHLMDLKISEVNSSGKGVSSSWSRDETTTTGKNIHVGASTINDSAIASPNRDSGNMAEVSEYLWDPDNNCMVPADLSDTTTYSSSEAEKLISNYKWVDSDGDGTYEKTLKTWPERIIDLYYAVENRSSLGISNADLTDILKNFQTDMETALSTQKVFDSVEYNKEVEAVMNSLRSWVNGISNLQFQYDRDLKSIPVKEIPDENDPKYEWYKNLWYRMGGISETQKSDNNNQYKVLDDTLMNNAEWLQFAFEHGILSMEQVTYNENGSSKYPNIGNYDWMSIQYNNAADISSEQDDIAIAKAEAKYQNALNEIEQQDKKYDQDLKKLDTEHSALQTEYDSVKSVIDKNVERSFKAFS